MMFGALWTIAAVMVNKFLHMKFEEINSTIT